MEGLLDRAGVPHTTKPIPTSSIYDYINMDLGNCLLVMPRKQGYDRVDAMYPKIKLIPVNEPEFKLSLDAAFLEKSRDESLDCLLEALVHCYGGSF